MGALLARFRKKKTTLEQLEHLDSNIKTIETFRLNTELTERRIVGHFILVSAVIYVLFAVVFYFYFFPATFYDQIFYIAPLLLAPFMLWGVKRSLTWYYRRKISRNDSELIRLRTEKKELLDKVMDTETYKVAKGILEKFAPEQLKRNVAPFEITPYKPVLTSSSPAFSLLKHKIPSASSSESFQTTTPRILSRTIPSTPIGSTNGAGARPQFRQQSVLHGAEMGENARVMLPLPREILPRDRSVLDRMVEYLVGDGPSNRYALICKNCESHNGMALREEFEYISFRCCYCYTINPARKMRPSAPKLEFNLTHASQQQQQQRRLSTDSTSTSSSERHSGTDSEVEHSGRKQRQKKGRQPQQEVEDIPMGVDLKMSQEKKSD